MKTAKLFIKTCKLFFACALIPASIFSQSTLSLINLKQIGIPSDLAKSIEVRIESTLPTFCHCLVISKDEIDGTIMSNLDQNNNHASEKRLSGQKNAATQIEKVVSGTLCKVGPSYSLVLNLINVQTGIIERSVSKEHNGSIEALFQFTDSTVAALFENVTVKPKVDTLYVSVPVQPVVNLHNYQEKELITQPQTKPISSQTPDDAAKVTMEQISIGAIAIFACIAGILLAGIKH